MPPIDLTGQRYGRLTVVRRVGARNRKALWECLCDCGRRKNVVGVELRAKKTKSCGCLRADTCSSLGKRTAATNSRAGAAKAADSRRRHGHAARSVRSPMYSTWEGTIARCYNPRSRKYHLYGGRGIHVCSRWRDSFEAFLADMGPRPSPDHSLDRYPDKDGNYEPGNVRWASRVAQARNTRANRLLTFNGETLCLAAWAEKLGVPKERISSRLRRGWTVERALTEARC